MGYHLDDHAIHVDDVIDGSADYLEGDKNGYSEGPGGTRQKAASSKGSS